MVLDCRPPVATLVWRYETAPKAGTYCVFVRGNLLEMFQNEANQKGGVVMAQTETRVEFLGRADKIHDFKPKPNYWNAVNAAHQSVGVVLQVCSRCGFDCSWPTEMTTIPCVPPKEGEVSF